MKKVMKRVLSWYIILGIAVNLLAVAVPAAASSDVQTGTFGAQGDNLTWTLDEDGVLTISGQGEMQEFTYSFNIPWDAYKNDIQSVIVENGVTNISDSLFTFSNITSLELPEGLESIGASAFYYCSKLTEVHIPGTVTYIGEGAFSTCGKVTQYTVAEDNAFFSSIDGVLFGNSGTVLLNYPAGKTARTYNMPETVNEIGPNAFAGSSLSELSIPASVQRIAADAFQNMSNLQTLHVSEDNAWYVFSDGAMMDKSMTKLLLYVGSQNAYTIPATVQEICDSAFADKFVLKQVTIPDCVKRIGENAFESCWNLQTVTLPSGLTELGQSAFGFCSSLTEIVIPSNLTVIEDSTFDYCSSLISVTIPASITRIGSFAFAGCTSLTDVLFQGTEDEWSCVAVGIYNEPLLDANLTFLGTEGHEHILTYFPETAPTCVEPGTAEYWQCSVCGRIFGDESCLRQVRQSELAIPPMGHTTVIDPGTEPTETSTGLSDGSHCSVCGTVLQEQEVLPVLAAVASGVFGVSEDNLTWELNNAGALTISGSGDMNDFYDIYGRIEERPWESYLQDIRKVRILPGVTSIGSGVFASSKSLMQVEIPDTVSDIGTAAFQYCQLLESVHIPDGISTIPHYLFCGCSGLKRVDLPDSVTAICAGAFSGCTALESVTLPAGLMFIYESAFSDCQSLPELVLPDGLLSIGRYAFQRCSSLTSVTIPASLTDIGSLVFSGCDQLSRFDVDQNNPSYSTDGRFLLNKERTKLIVIISGALTGDCVLPSGVTYIEDFALERCFGITSLTVPGSVKTIGNSAFSYCSALTEVVLEYGTETLLACAFTKCSALTSVTIPGSVKTIGNSSFWGCNQLSDVYFLGSESEWNRITIENGNNELLNANIHFMGIPEHTHIMTAYPACPATCTESGNSAYWYCSACGRYFADEGGTVQIEQGSWYLPGGHTVVIDPAVAPTATEPGLTEGSHCSVCGVILQRQEIVLVPDSVDCGYCGAEGDNLTWVLDSEGVLTIYGSGAMADFTYSSVLPPRRWGDDIRKVVISQGVTNIGRNAFRDCGLLCEITIPNSVKTIGDGAFERCFSLENVFLPDGLYEIGRWAFYYCGITNIVIPDSVRFIGDEAFYLSDLTSLTISGTATDLGDTVFGGCHLSELYTDSIESWLTLCSKLDYGCVETLFINGETLRGELVIPIGVTEIPGCAFHDCTGITNVVIPDSVTEIGYYAFNGCSALTSIVLPDSVIALGYGAFSGCSSVEWIDTGNGLSSLDGFYYPDSLQKIVIGNNITAIASYEFAGCKNLKTVVIGSGVTHIGREAFRGCSALSSLTLFNVCDDFASDAFEACDGLLEVRIPSLEDWFRFIASPYAPHLAPGGDLYIGGELLRSVVIPENLTQLPYGAFMNCSSLESVTIPEGIESIESHAFSGCSSLESVTIPEGIEDIESYAFARCSSLESISMPDSVISVWNGAFEDCVQLKDVTFSQQTSQILEDAFHGCVSLESVVLPKCAVDNNAFRDCTGLKTLVIPFGASVLEGAFRGCSNLSDLTLPLEGPTLSNENSYYCYNVGHLFGTESYPGGVLTEQAYASWNADYIHSWSTQYYIPATMHSVTVLGSRIPTYAFDQCANITDIILSADVNEINEGAFRGCSSLVQITLPDGITNLAAELFAGCSSLQSLSIPDSVTSIGNKAFAGCSSLESMAFSDSVTNIGTGVFAACSSLESLVLPVLGTRESDTFTRLFGKEPFDGGVEAKHDLADVSYYLPDTLTEVTITGDIPKYAFEACNTLKTIVIQNNSTEIPEYAFAGCSSLQQVILPTGVTTINSHAFQDCINLTELSFLKDTRYIDSYAFANTGLIDIALPTTIPTIREGAFSDCSSLTTVKIPEGYTTVSAKMFRNCPALTSVILPESMETVYGSAFEDCGALRHLYCLGDAPDVPDSQTFVGWPSSLTIHCYAYSWGWEAEAWNGCRISYLGELTDESDRFVLPLCRKSRIPDGYIPIYTTEQLAAIHEQTDGHFLLMNDLDMTGVSWKPVSGFSGIFDGNGYTVSNLTVTVGTTDYTGMFGDSSGIIRNLCLTGERFDAKFEFGSVHSGIGSIAGRAADIRNCTADTDIDFYQVLIAGGIAGSADFVMDCCFSGQMNVTLMGASATYCGGITGKGTQIIRCLNTGDITGYELYTDLFEVGGIAGSCSTVEFCCNTGTIHGASNRDHTVSVGGIAGYSATITNCVNMGVVTESHEYAGMSGGIVGTMERSERMENCCGYGVNQDNVSSFGYKGSVVGMVRGTTQQFVNVYGRDKLATAFTGNGSGGTYSAEGLFTLSDAEFTLRTSFAGFDFDRVWFLKSGMSCPELQAFRHILHPTGATPEQGYVMEYPAQWEHFGHPDKEVQIGSIGIDGTAYPISDDCAFFHDYDYYSQRGNVLEDYVYVVFNLNNDGELCAIDYLPGELCRLTDWDADSRSMNVSREAEKSAAQQTVDAVYCVSDIVTDRFPFTRIASLETEQILLYTAGNQAFHAIHVVRDTGMVTAYDDSVLPGRITIGQTTYQTALGLGSLADEVAFHLSGANRYLPLAEYTLYDDVLVALSFQYSTLDPAKFNQLIYQAEQALNPGNEDYAAYNEVLNGRMNNTDTPTGITIDACKDSGFAALAYTWTISNEVMGIMTFSSPSGVIEKLTVKPVDVYTAIILDALQCSFSAGVISAAKKDSKDVRDFCNLSLSMVSEMERADRENLESRWTAFRGSLSNDDKARISKYVGKQYDKQFGKSAADDFMDYLSFGLDAASSFESWLEEAVSYAKVLQLSRETQTIIKQMRDSCTELYLSSALDRVAEVIDAGIQNYKEQVFLRGVETVGTFAVKEGFDIFWKNCVGKTVKELFPAVAAVKLAYTAAKMVAEASVNLSKESEAYFKLLAMDKFETLGKSVLKTNADAFLADPTEENAKLYLEAAKLNFQILQTDADCAIQFFKEIDKGGLSWISEFAAGTTVEAVNENFNEYRRILSMNQTLFDAKWVDSLYYDYPDLYEDYLDLIRETNQKLSELRVACPVNVFVYDSFGNLAASVVDGRPSADGNVTVTVIGEEKIFSFYDDQSYSICCDGYDSGTMDIMLTEYNDAEEVSRAVHYLDVPVTVNSEHSLTITEEPEESRIVMTGGEIEMQPDYDSIIPAEKHHCTIVSGYATTNRTFVMETEACAGENIDLTAYVPQGWSFEGWTSDGSGKFRNASVSSTEFIMPDCDVTVTAVSRPPYRVFPDDGITTTIEDGTESTALAVVTNTSDTARAVSCMLLAFDSDGRMVCGQPFHEVLNAGERKEIQLIGPVGAAFSIVRLLRVEPESYIPMREPIEFFVHS